MGLQEKRIIAAYQKDKFPGWQKRIAGVCGVELSWDVSWEELVKEAEKWGEAYPNTLDYNFFMPLENALKSVCGDDLGKTAFKAKIKKVKIGSTRSWSSLEVKIEGDTLHLDADPTYQRDDSAIADYAQRITGELEKAL